MEELLKRIQSEHGISEEKSMTILNTIKEYIKEKSPMVSGVVDNLFQTNPEAPESRPDLKNTRIGHDDFPD